MKTIDEQLPTHFCEGAEASLRHMIGPLIVMAAATYRGGEFDPEAASALIDSVELNRMTNAIITRANEEASIEEENHNGTYCGSLIAIASHMAGVLAREIVKNGGDVDSAISRIARR